jgi:hypothetical protein
MNRPGKPTTAADFDGIRRSLQMVADELLKGGKGNVELCYAADVLKIRSAGVEPDAKIQEGSPLPVPGLNYVQESVNRNAAFPPILRGAFLAIVEAIPNSYHQGNQTSDAKLLGDILRLIEDFERFAPTEKTGAPAGQLPQTSRGDSKSLPTVQEQPEFTHSKDYRSVSWRGEQFSFSANQAAVIRELHEAWTNGTPELGHETLLQAVDKEAPPERLNVLFRGHPAWKTLIVDGKTKGSYRLALFDS